MTVITGLLAFSFYLLPIYCQSRNRLLCAMSKSSKSVASSSKLVQFQLPGQKLKLYFLNYI